MPVDRGPLYAGLGGDGLDRRSGGPDAPMQPHRRLRDRQTRLRLLLGAAALAVHAA